VKVIQVSKNVNQLEGLVQRGVVPKYELNCFTLWPILNVFGQFDLQGKGHSGVRVKNTGP
jgi:hypothetical protein